MIKMALLLSPLQRKILKVDPRPYKFPVSPHTVAVGLSQSVLTISCFIALVALPQLRHKVQLHVLGSSHHSVGAHLLQCCTLPFLIGALGTL